MILRRIVENVRARDWFTVTIEFLIVVVGIFVGLEVSNWNEARKFAAQERFYLEQLREEMQNNLDVVELRVAFTAEVIGAGERALVYLDGDGDCGSQCAELLVDFFHASQVWGSSMLQAKYRELERLGFPSDPTVRELTRDYNQFLLDGSYVNEFAPAYRETVRGHISPAAFRQLWGHCYAILSGQIEALSRDCVADLGLLESRTILQDIHADPVVRQQLQFWLGQNILAETVFPGMRTRGAAAMAALERELAGTR